MPMATSASVRLARRTWRQLFPPPTWAEGGRSYEEDLMELRSIAHEGSEREEDVRRLLADVRDDERLVEVAPEAGELVSRYLALRRETARIRAPSLRPHAAALGEVFDYFAQLLYYAVDLLAESWRSDRLCEQRLLVGPIGPQSDRLDAIVFELDYLAGSLGLVK
jgi:hypothetical protein